MLDLLRQHRLYIAMVVINLAVLIGVIYLLRRPEPRVIAITTPAPRPTLTPALIQVQVRGAVNQPGVYQLPLGARVPDALERAGGARPDADLTALNLARKLNDGEDVNVPPRKATAAPVTATISAASALTATIGATSALTATATVTAAAKININTAGLDELTKLPRIGPALAQRIIDYRMQNGPFKKIQDLKNVKGIGDAIFDDLEELVAVQ